MNELDTLENNIARAIEVIQSLSQKNEELQKKNESLIANIIEHERKIQHLQEENHKFKNNPEIRYIDKEKEKKIRIKIQHIIEKLESFEKLSNNH